MGLWRIAVLAAVLIAPLSVAAEQEGTTFAWVTQNMHFYDAARLHDDTVRQQLESAFVGELERKGLKFVASTDIADLGLSYVAVLENAADAATIADFWQLHPEIANAEERPSEFEDGMLFAKLVDLKSGETVWKHTYHGLVALDMPEEPRRQRLQEIIELFLATYPQ